jgi:hypothetical protein
MVRGKIYLFILNMLFLSLFLLSCSNQNFVDTTDSQLLEISDKGDEIKKSKDGTKYIIDPKKIRGGGPPKDGIPSIDDPIYQPLKLADDWIEDNELVLAIEYKGVKRVYPLQILVWHEIVNDNIAGDPILITYCPLCGSGIAYDPTIVVDGKEITSEFGTSGKLYNSNLIMYDRETGTYWSQIGGKAIIGELVGQELKEISIDTVVWRDYKKENEFAEVLSKVTGHSRNYGVDPYGNYYEDSFLIFPVENEDNRIHPKTIIFGIELDGVFKAYKEDDLKKTPVVEDVVNGVNVKIERDSVGIVKIINIDDGSEIVKERDMWFAWYAFHPETSLYEAK